MRRRSVAGAPAAAGAGLHAWVFVTSIPASSEGRLEVAPGQLPALLDHDAPLMVVIDLDLEPSEVRRLLRSSLRHPSRPRVALAGRPASRWALALDPARKGTIHGVFAAPLDAATLRDGARSASPGAAAVVREICRIIRQ